MSDNSESIEYLVMLNEVKYLAVESGLRIDSHPRPGSFASLRMT